MKTTQQEIEAYRATLEIAYTTWDLASAKAVRTGHPEDLMEAQAAMHWLQVARTNLNNAEAGVR